jgi:hypothetical protein
MSDCFKVRLAQDQQPIQTFLSNRAEPAFGKAVDLPGAHPPDPEGREKSGNAKIESD